MDQLIDSHQPVRLSEILTIFVDDMASVIPDQEARSGIILSLFLLSDAQWPAVRTALAALQGDQFYQPIVTVENIRAVFSHAHPENFVLALWHLECRNMLSTDTRQMLQAQAENPYGFARVLVLLPRDVTSDDLARLKTRQCFDELAVVLKVMWGLQPGLALEDAQKLLTCSDQKVCALENALNAVNGGFSLKKIRDFLASDHLSQAFCTQSEGLQQSVRVC